jgi:hypothetical protein
VRLPPFSIQKLAHLLDKRRKFIVVLFGCDFSGQLPQAFSVVILAFVLHGAFPRPVAERPVFGFSRSVRVLQNGVRT